MDGVYVSPLNCYPVSKSSVTKPSATPRFDRLSVCMLMIYSQPMPRSSRLHRESGRGLPRKRIVIY
jgi:hypothetical protein